jgi:hypothetical protein
VSGQFGGGESEGAQVKRAQLLGSTGGYRRLKLLLVIPWQMLQKITAGRRDGSLEFRIPLLVEVNDCVSALETGCDGASLFVYHAVP